MAMVMRDLGRRVRGGLVFGAWAGTLIFLALTDRTRLFLHPGFAWLLGIGAVIASGFLVAILRNPVPLPLSRTLILLVPLLHLAASNPASMGHDIFSKRFLGASIMASDADDPAYWTDGPMDTMAEADTVPDEVVSQGFASQGFTADKPATDELPLTILQLLRAPQTHAGTMVKLLGLIHRDAELEIHFGPGRKAALYRFVLNCCVADALPVTVALEGEIPDLTADQWVEAQGSFDLIPFDNGSVPVLKVDRITPVPAPTDPFLY